MRSRATTPAKCRCISPSCTARCRSPASWRWRPGARGQDLQFDYLHATRYRGETTGGELVWKHRPATALFGRRVILVDDILDEGYTLQGVRQWCLEQGATDVRVAVLTVKRHDRCVPGVTADYVGVEVADRYVFGFGMDVNEQLRGIPAIYAMKQ